MENQVRDAHVRLRHSAAPETPLHDAIRRVGPGLLQPSQPSVPSSLCRGLRVAYTHAPTQSEAKRIFVWMRC